MPSQRYPRSPVATHGATSQTSLTSRDPRSNKPTTRENISGPAVSARSNIPRPALTVNRALGDSSAIDSEEEDNAIPPPARFSRSFSSDAARPTGLPRMAANPSSSNMRLRRPSASSANSAPLSSPTLSLGSSAATVPQVAPKPTKYVVTGERTRNVLRRKAAFSRQKMETNKIENTSPSTTGAPAKPLPSLTTGSNFYSTSIPTTSQPNSQSTVTTTIVRTTTPHNNPRILKELASLQTVVNPHSLPPPPPTPGYPSTGSPSTRYSESPGVWSRTSTPTSLSSYSPGIVQPAKGVHRLRQPSPTPVHPSLLQSPHLMNPSTTLDKQEIKPQGQQLSVGATGQNVKIPHGSPEDVTIPYGPPKLARSPPPRQSSRNFRSQSDTNDSCEPHSISHTVEQPEQLQVEPGSSSVNDHGQESVASPSVPPRRPSREGTEKLDVSPSPVVQSNLTAFHITGHKRRESTEKSQTAATTRSPLTASASMSAESLHSNMSSRSSQTRTDGTVQPTPTWTKSPRNAQEENKAFPSRRFGFLSKKSKGNLNTSNSSPAPKPPRKGPTAGTGHEGYGKYSQRGRRTSIGSSHGTRARSTSTSASTGVRSVSSSRGTQPGRSDLGIDDFFLERLEPVFISGGGLERPSLARTQRNQSVSSISVASTTASSPPDIGPIFSGYSSGSLVSAVESHSQLPHSRLLPPRTRQPQVAGSQRASPSLSRDASFQSLRDLGAEKNNKQPLMMTSSNTSDNSAESSFSALPQIKASDRTLEDGSSSKYPKAAKKAEKKQKGITRWNFFHRTRAAEKKAVEPTPVTKPTTQLHATVSTVPGNKPVAHYALLDADSDSLEEILYRVEDSPPSEDGQEQTSSTAAGLGLERRGISVLLPSPPALMAEFSNSQGIRPNSPKVYFGKDTEVYNKPMVERPSRLVSVGRIPPVVTRRDQEHKPSDLSFSRLASRREAPSLAITTNTQPELYYSSSRPPLDIQTDLLPSRPFGSESTDTPKPFSAPVVGDDVFFPPGPYSTNEFLRFSPRKGSQISSSTSESDSIMAVVKAMGSSLDAKIMEEDVWTEYDDLLDNVLLPVNVNPKDATLQPEGQFELATQASKTLQAELNASDERPHTSDVPDTPSIIPPLSRKSSDGSFRLSHSKIAPALYSPPPQVSYGELMAAYSETHKSNSELPHADSSSPGTVIEDQPSETLPPLPLLQTDFESARRRNTLLFDMAERHRDGAIAQTNLRSASLMTSRWLSFGRVLFSPAHNHITSGDQQRILVIDGLGNDDWSFYCALTYPTATVYSLSIGPDSSSSPSSSSHPGGWDPPANHHLIHHPSVDALFPFPKGFFAACVLRFPATCSEMGQLNVISECKRVLRPGGYLEISVLDLDLVNMGSRTRKAVRMLKERICLADASISLKPASDNIQRLLGTCGYDNLNRCMVGLPVAGIIVGSLDSSHSNGSTQEGPTPTTSASESTSGSQPYRARPTVDAEVSLGDLLSDPSPSASNDESIAKMVARVGRWWYTRCHEIPVISDGDLDGSIFADPLLLRECQKLGTGFRLLICYAQKSSERRRTVSV